MNITLVLQQKLHAAFRALAARTATFHEPVARELRPMQHACGPVARKPVCAAPRRAVAGMAHTGSVTKPLRVVRVMESGQARSSVGRMVISGRMADVCAELDRLVAHEAAIH